VAFLVNRGDLSPPKPDVEEMAGREGRNRLRLAVALPHQSPISASISV